MCACESVCVCVLIICGVVLWATPRTLKQNLKKIQFTAQPHVQKKQDLPYLNNIPSSHYRCLCCLCLTFVCVHVHASVSGAADCLVISFLCTQRICAKPSKAIGVCLRTPSVLRPQILIGLFSSECCKLVKVTLLKGTRASFCEIITRTNYLTHTKQNDW